MSNFIRRIRHIISIMELNAQAEFHGSDSPIYDRLEKEWVKTYGKAVM